MEGSFGVPLREYTERQFKTIDAQLASIDRRLARLDEERSSYVRSTRYEERHDQLDRRVTVNENRLSTMEGRAWSITIFASLASATISGLLVHLLGSAG